MRVQNLGFFLLGMLLSGKAPLAAQAPAKPDSAKAAGAPASQSVPSQLGLVVFPAKGQPKEQQAADENECYGWAVTNTGVDPAKVSVNTDSAAAAGKAKGDSAGQGAGAKGAARGAVGGAVVGGIAGDAGTGAAIGAVAGAAGGRRAKKQAKKQGEQQAVNQANAEAAGKIDAFKKGMSACLEGKGYSVK
jgi:Glycine zipper